MAQILSEYGHLIGSGNANIQVSALINQTPIGRIVQYVGPTTSSYTTGFFYQRTAQGWERINTQPEQASAIEYDNTASGSTATTIQEAVDSALTSLGGVSFSVIEDE